MTPKDELIRINLNATASSDIIWSTEQKRADEIVEQSGRILWEFEFGCTSFRGFRLQDTLQWNTHRLAIEHFTTSIWPKYRMVTAGISLFQGSLDWIHHLYWDEMQKEHFESWKRVSRVLGASSCHLQTTSLKDLNQNILSLYAIEQLSDYLHRLSAYLPEDAVRFVSFDIEKSTPIWQIAQALSRERFPYILTDTIHSPISSLHTQVAGRGSLAICLPQDEHLTVETGELWESIYIELQKKSVPFRVIPEIFIAEDWADLEEIVVLTNSLSEFGLRQLQGFSISGGKIIFCGKPLEISNAIDWSHWIR
ncbi:MAG: hypothetical protein ACRCSV_02335 [Chlamydiales bacterium]